MSNLEGGDGAIAAAAGLAAMVGAKGYEWWKKRNPTAPPPPPIVPIVDVTTTLRKNFAAIQRFATTYLKKQTLLDVQHIEAILAVSEGSGNTSIWRQIKKRSGSSLTPSELRQDYLDHITATDEPPHLYQEESLQLDYVQMQGWSEFRRQNANDDKAPPPAIVLQDGVPLHPMVADDSQDAFVYTDERLFASTACITTPDSNGCVQLDAEVELMRGATVVLSKDGQEQSRGTMTEEGAKQNGIQKWKVAGLQAPQLQDILEAGKDGARYTLSVEINGQLQEELAWTVKAVAADRTSRSTTNKQAYVNFQGYETAVTWPLSVAQRDTLLSDNAAVGTPRWEDVTFYAKPTHNTGTQEVALRPNLDDDVTQQDAQRRYGDVGGSFLVDAAQPWLAAQHVESRRALPPLGWSTQDHAEQYRLANLRPNVVAFLEMQQQQLTQQAEELQQCIALDNEQLPDLPAVGTGGNLRQLLTGLQSHLQQAQSLWQNFAALEMSGFQDLSAYMAAKHLIPGTRDVEIKARQAEAQNAALTKALEAALQKVSSLTTRASATVTPAPAPAPVQDVKVPLVPPIVPPPPLLPPPPPVPPVVQPTPTASITQFKTWLDRHWPKPSSRKGQKKRQAVRAVLLLAFEQGALLRDLPTDEAALRQHLDRMGQDGSPIVLYCLDDQHTPPALKFFVSTTTGSCEEGSKSLKLTASTSSHVCTTTLASINAKVKTVLKDDDQENEWLIVQVPMVRYWLYRALKTLSKHGILDSQEQQAGLLRMPRTKLSAVEQERMLSALYGLARLPTIDVTHTQHINQYLLEQRSQPEQTRHALVMLMEQVYAKSRGLA